MADSNITKHALAESLKKLMEENPFDKINVGDICEKCGMNRKSFYYHFRDKYDLVNWIFDTEFILAMSNKKPSENAWNFMERLLEYLYNHRDFYRKAFKIEGQNSFPEHFQEVLISVVGEYINENVIFNSVRSGKSCSEKEKDFYSFFIADGIVCAIKRWILDKNCIEPNEFLELIHSCITGMAEKVHNETKNEN